MHNHIPGRFLPKCKKICISDLGWFVQKIQLRTVQWNAMWNGWHRFTVSKLNVCIWVFAGSFKSQLIDYFRGHIVSWETFGRFMLIRTKWRFWTSWRHFGCSLSRSQLLCSWRNFYFFLIGDVFCRIWWNTNAWIEVSLKIFCYPSLWGAVLAFLCLRLEIMGSNTDILVKILSNSVDLLRKFWMSNFIKFKFLVHGYLNPSFMTARHTK